MVELAPPFNEIKQRTVQVNGINIHFAEKGPENAPIVLFLHGFPELWYTWRHQIMTLSSLGYRAIAPDMRGYGGTDAPKDSTKYTYGHIVGDLVGLIDELGAQQVFLVGHDWGAIIAWWFCLFRPDRVKALVNTSVAFSPRDPTGPPLEKEPGEMEAEVAKAGGADALLRKIFPDRSPGPLLLPKGKAFDDLQPYPCWLTDEDIAYYTHTFNRTGFTGGFNYYRAMNLNWQLTAPWTGAQVMVPVKFLVGDLDLSYYMPGVKDYINSGKMKKDVPFLKEVVILPGVAHFLQEEIPDVISKHISDFIQKF